MGIYVGLDCGGSSSRVLAMDDAGNQVFVGSSGAANILVTPESRLRRNLANATRDCPRPTFVCGCFAGLINEETKHKAEEILRDIFPASQVRAEPDFTAAFFASAPGTSICVIAGTGSLVCSWTKSGIVKSGGRGYIIGDVGSGYQFGRDALIFYLDHPDQASPHLKDAVIATFGNAKESEIIQALYRSGTPAMLIGKLMKAVANDAQHGQDYALASIEGNSLALAETTAQHALKYVNTSLVNVSVAGGVWKASPLFISAFTRHLSNLLVDREIVVQKILRPPLHGAVALAKELARGN